MDRILPTKDQLLKRFETCIDKGLCQPHLLALMERWLDFVIRFEGGQISDVARFLQEEHKRHALYGPKDAMTLANDKDGYCLIQLAAILNHPCQKCAEDPNAWHTRAAFCEHKPKEGGW